MKKIIAYYLLTQTVCLILLSNLVIYYGYEASRKEQDWITSMKNVPDHAFNVIKLNASIYSFSEDSEMEYVNNNVSVGGKNYHVFKRKIKDNILYIYYLKNKNQLSKNLKRLINDAGAETKLPVKKVLKATIGDFLEIISFKSNSFAFKIADACVKNIDIIKSPLSGYKNLAYLPPKIF